MPTGNLNMRLRFRSNLQRRLKPAARQLARLNRRLVRHPRTELRPLPVDGGAYHQRWRRR
jgi:hypothetical protein